MKKEWNERKKGNRNRKQSQSPMPELVVTVLRKKGHIIIATANYSRNSINNVYGLTIDKQCEIITHTS